MIARTMHSGSSTPARESPEAPTIARRLVRGLATGVLAVLGVAHVFDLWNYSFSYIEYALDIGPVRIDYPFLGHIFYPINVFYLPITGMIYGATLLLAPPSLVAIKVATPGLLSGWPLRILVGVVSSYVLIWMTVWSLYILVWPNLEMFSVMGKLLIALFGSVAFWAFRRSSAQPLSGRRRSIPLITLVTSILLLPIYVVIVSGREYGPRDFDVGPTLLVLFVALWFVTAALYVVSCSLCLKALLQSDPRRHVVPAVLLGLTLVVLTVELWIGRLRPFV